MGQALDPEMMAAMREKGQKAQERSSSGSSKIRIDLYGNKAVVKPGGDVGIRLLPRWDIKERYKLVKGKLEIDPSYDKRPVADRFAFCEAKEHWWDGPEGKARRGWCLRSFDESMECPYCERSAELMNSKDQAERKAGYRMQAHDVYVYNAILLDPDGNRTFTDDGKPDIKYVIINQNIFVGITSAMTGGKKSDQFAFGDITHHTQGHDLLLTRPLAGQGGKWSVQAAPNPSRLYIAEDASNWKGWMELLHNLPEMVQSEMGDYDSATARLDGGEQQAAEDPPAEDGTTAPEEEPASPEDLAPTEEIPDESSPAGDDSPWGLPEDEPAPKKNTAKVPAKTPAPAKTVAKTVAKPAARPGQVRR